MYRGSRFKVDDPLLRVKIKKLIATTRKPVSVDYVAKNTNLSWSTAKELLLEMALLGEIDAEKTTKSWIFFAEIRKRGRWKDEGGS